jgi:WD repeat-containing protein 23
MQLLGHAGLRRMFANHNNGGGGITLQIDEDELDDGFGILGSRRRQRARSTKNQFPAVPSEIGQKLMDGGVFGTSEYYRDSLRKRNKKLARKLMSRELGNDRNHSTRATSAVSQV